MRRVDVGKVKGEQDNVHFDDGRSLNRDGTWKHGEGTVTAKQRELLQKKRMEDSQLKKRIRSWMTRVIQEGTHASFDDLHVDEISDRFRDQMTWFDGAVECLQLTALIRNAEQWPFAVAVGFSLRSNPVPYGLRSNSVLDLTKEFDDSPPSLYLFERGNEPWRTDKDFADVSIDFQPRMNIRMRTYLREWFDENDADFRRSFWIGA